MTSPSASLFKSFLHAWNGLVHTVVSQRNMRLHLIAGILVGMVGSGIPLGLAEKVTLVFCVLLVLFAEVLNTALEQLVDLAIQELDPKARIAKDTAAAGVLVLALGTVVIFALVLVHNASAIATGGRQIARQVALGVPLATCTGYLIRDKRRTAWKDALALCVAAALWGATLRHTTSAVFSAMTLGLLLLAYAAATARRQP